MWRLQCKRDDYCSNWSKDFSMHQVGINSHYSESSWVKVASKWAPRHATNLWLLQTAHDQYLLLRQHLPQADTTHVVGEWTRFACALSEWVEKYGTWDILTCCKHWTDLVQTWRRLSSWTLLRARHPVAVLSGTGKHAELILAAHRMYSLYDCQGDV